SIPPTASEASRRDLNSGASVPSDYLAPCYQYVSSAVNKYVVYTISREYSLGPDHPVHGRGIGRSVLTRSASRNPGQKPDETRAGNECGYVLERDLFDRYLAKEAAKAGAEILIKTSAVELLRDDGQIVGARCEHMADAFEVRAKVVIGADGFESQVGRWAGLETHLRTRDIDACLQYTMVGVAGDPRYNDV